MAQTKGWKVIYFMDKGWFIGYYQINECWCLSSSMVSGFIYKLSHTIKFHKFKKMRGNMFNISITNLFRPVNIWEVKVPKKYKIYACLFRRCIYML